MVFSLRVLDVIPILGLLSSRILVTEWPRLLEGMNIGLYGVQ